VYAPPPRQQRIRAAGLSACAVALVGWALLSGLDVAHVVQAVAPLVSVDLNPPPSPKPPEPPRERPRPVHKSAPKEAPSAHNIRNKATPVVAPIIKPIVQPPPLIAAPKPGTGAATNNGASNRAGPGEGAGGFGNGRGGGGDGGDGDGTPPMHIAGKLRFSDLPKDIAQSHGGASVGISYAVGIDGRVSGCKVTRTSGSAELDALTCRLIEERFRFRPSLDENGKPVRAVIVGETHSWSYDRSADEHDND